jgi:hypothetical protein
MLTQRTLALWGAAFALGALTSACKREDPAPSAATTSAKPAAPVASGLPGDPAKVSRVVNPGNVPAYSGPVGSVRGIVTATGDPAPPTPEHLQKVQGNCPEARQTYAHLFREGMLRSLADVLVAVTGYDAYVPEKQPHVTLGASGCAFERRTVALTYGQTLEVVSKDRDAYVPNLLGARMKAQILALPRGKGSTLYPPEPGHYLLTDDIKLFMLADVFVLKYATHDVTKLDGRYEIAGIPAGKVTLSALLPSTQATVEKEIEIKAGEALEVAIEIPFDQRAYEEKRKAASPQGSAAAPASAPSASARPGATLGH